MASRENSADGGTVTRLREWRRGKLWPVVKHMPRLKHLRGTWLHRRLGDRLFHDDVWQPRRNRFAAGVSVGVFFGMLPLPMQMLAAALIAFLTRANIPAAIVATWLSNPATLPVIVYLQYELGSFLLGKAGHPLPDGSFLEMLAKAPLPILLGAITAAILASLVAYPISLWAWDVLYPRFFQAKARAQQVPDPGPQNGPGPDEREKN